MRIKPARYLLRFDDLCPTMSRSKWESFLAIISEYRLRPILAVIPDNQDPDLKIDDPDPQFWDRMRALQAAGAAIAMHGYRHLCASRGKSILGLHRNTEFAGVDEETQRTWIRAGLATLRAHGLDPRLFVAPRHGFDQSTLSALAAEGLRFLSDGFATRPFTRDNVIWIPQQLWEPILKKAGLWTICLHTNTSCTALSEKLDRFVRASRQQFVSFDDVLENYPPSNLDHIERLGAWLAIRRVHSHRTR